MGKQNCSLVCRTEYWIASRAESFYVSKCAANDRMRDTKEKMNGVKGNLTGDFMLRSP